MYHYNCYYYYYYYFITMLTEATITTSSTAMTTTITKATILQLLQLMVNIAGGIPKCCVKTFMDIPTNLLRRAEMQLSNGVCEFNTILSRVLSLESFKLSYCTGRCSYDILVCLI